MIYPDDGEKVNTSVASDYHQVYNALDLSGNAAEPLHITIRVVP